MYIRKARNIKPQWTAEAQKVKLSKNKEGQATGQNGLQMPLKRMEWSKSMLQDLPDSAGWGC